MSILDRVRLILDNLLLNALKNAPAGSRITITVHPRPDAGPPEALDRPRDDSACLFRRVAPIVARPDSPFVEVSVHNEGRPIASHLHTTLFNAFVRGPQEGKDARSTGLGLSIVDQCARHLGGSVWMTSTETEGTTFRFTLPSEIVGSGDGNGGNPEDQDGMTRIGPEDGE